MARSPSDREIRAAFGLDSPMDHLGRIALIALVGIVLVGVAVLFMPTGPTTVAYGTVVRMVFVPTEHGARRSATVRVGDSERSVKLSASDVCRPGERIRLMRRKTILGTPTFQAAYGEPCDHGPPAPPA